MQDKPRAPNTNAQENCPTPEMCPPHTRLPASSTCTHPGQRQVVALRAAPNTNVLRLLALSPASAPSAAQEPRQSAFSAPDIRFPSARLHVGQPRMVERLLRRQAPVRIQEKQPRHKSNGVRRQPDVAREGEGAPAHCLKPLQVVLAVEGRLPAQEHVGDDADTPHVARGSVACGPVLVEHEDLVRHVVGRTQHRVEPICAIEDLAEPEVDQLDCRVLPLVVHHEVLELEIPVAYVSLMAEVDGLHDAPDQARNLGFR
mmetsp:Transcript_29967/g.73767  ORF Transcript_29967/g.73767 Transcript_29967/m.73767 type:complete len:258 (+) Transcript_29967:310-1083(+)